MTYQHEARGADETISDATDSHVNHEQRKDDDGDDCLAGGARARLIARQALPGSRRPVFRHGSARVSRSYLLGSFHIPVTEDVHSRRTAWTRHYRTP